MGVDSVRIRPSRPAKIMFTPSQLKWIFVSLVSLRLIVGFHFFTEGKSKIDQGDWSAAPFFSAAKGPLAPYFHSLLPDWDYSETLCVIRGPAAKIGDGKVSQVSAKDADNKNSASPESVVKLDPFRTFGQWQLFLEDVLIGYRLKQTEIAARIESLDESLARLEREIQSAGAVGDSRLEEDLKLQQSQRQALRDRLTKVDPLFDLLQIMERRQAQLNEYLEFPGHREEILKSVADEDRLQGFLRDGPNRHQSAVQVESLRKQVDTIRNEIRSVRAKHAGEVQGIWTGLEEEMNAYGLSMLSPLETGVTMQPKVPLKKPFDILPTHQLYWINTLVPYFDLAIGILLLVGLFSRVTSLAAAGFLLGIIATQPIWVPGHDPKIIWNLVEFGALLVLAATVAGRFGGLDYFLYRLFEKKELER